jgi:hypothetical protein
MSSDTKVKSERRPGRPKKIQAANEIQRFGIVKTPSRPNYLLECIIPNPVMFKKFASLFTGATYKILHLTFEKDYFTIKFVDVNNFNKGMIRYEAKSLVKYYIEQPFKTQIQAAHFKCTNKIKKDSYSTVSFIVDKNSKQKLQVNLQQASAGGMSNINSLDTIYSSDIPYPTDDEYNINSIYDFGFKLDAKSVKDVVSDKKAVQNNLTIDYNSNDGGDPYCTFHTRGEKGDTISEFPINNIEYLRERKEVEKKKIIGISIYLSALRKIPSALTFKDELTKKEVKMFFKISDTLPLKITSTINGGAVLFDYVINKIDYNSSLTNSDVLAVQDVKQDTKQDAKTPAPVVLPPHEEFDITAIMNNYQSSTKKELETEEDDGEEEDKKTPAPQSIEDLLSIVE